MNKNITIFSRFLGYIQAKMFYKKRIAQLLNVKVADLDRAYREISESELMKGIPAKLNINKGFFDFSMLSVLRAPTLYVLCRILKPEVVVETGVADGFSSSFILYALEKNQKGHLYSIDLPNQPGQELGKGRGVGWLVEEKFKARWTLILGSSKEKLPILLDKLNKLDVFYHDSDHSYENMMFEFNVVEKYLKPDGFLIADDITENNAFEEFCKKPHFKAQKLFKIGIAKKNG